jgi:hypothetical protein
MTRPIPEGVVPPNGCVILGWGGEFKVPDSGMFNGWAIDLSYCHSWQEGEWTGISTATIYAADRDSEVARMNTNPTQISTSAVDPKDALIRELVGALKGMLDQELPSDLWMRHCVEAERVLTLARTTCPEAFDGCNENSSS